MKKSICILLSLLLVFCFCISASADPARIFELNGDVLTVRFPEGVLPVFSFISGDYTMEALTDGETADGITAVSYRLPEAARSESQLFMALVDESAGEGTDIRSMLLCTQENGDLYCMGESHYTPEYYIDNSEGYEYSDGRTLYIRLPGSPATGYEWTLQPDNSGLLELVDSYEIDMTENDQETLVSGTGFFFLPAENAADATGSMRFTLDKAPEGETVDTVLIFAFTLDENGQITEVTEVR